MKLAPLLAQYLFQQKKIDLTGIGTFQLDPSALKHPDPQHTSEGVSFQHLPSVKGDEGLINYISAETGKMKTLASSDLQSYLELAREFLNIGKPFQIEGIGTLVKNKSGELEFTADYVLIDKVKESGIKELSATSISDESLTTYENLRPHGEQSSTPRKVFLTLLAIITIGGIVWIGYKTYKNNSSKTTPQQRAATEAVPAIDSAKYVSARDSAAPRVQMQAKTGAGNYRFVIEVADKKRAFYRYQTLRKGNVPVQISTTDSITYKLFFILAASPTDTSRISDSLTVWYPARNHQKTFAEQ